MPQPSGTRKQATPGFNTTHKLKQLLLLLQQLPGNSERIPLVLGPTSSGKTALMRQLCRKAPSVWRLCRVEGSPDINGPSLIRQLAQDWMPGHQVSKKSALMAGLAELKQQGVLPVVVVDDADRLPQEALRLLLQLHREARSAAFHPILFADNEQLSEMQRLAAGDPLQLLHLSPWTAEEVAAFFKLEKGKTPSHAQLERLLEHTAGWPGRLVEMLDDPLALNPSRFNLVLGLVLILLMLISLFFARLPDSDAPPAPVRSPAQVKPGSPGETQTLTLGLPELESRTPREKSVQSKPVRTLKLEDNSWLKEHSGRGYTLQLGFFTRMTDLKGYAGKHRLDQAQPMAGLKWGEGYLLIYGVYPDHRAAVRARLLVPDSLDPERIKVRRLSSLQKEVK